MVFEIPIRYPPVYWEGAVRAFENATPVGRGYLELTGYVQPLRL